MDTSDPNNENPTVEDELLEFGYSSIEFVNEFYRANNWDAEYRQLSPGPLQMKIYGRQSGALTLFREQTNCLMSANAMSAAEDYSLVISRADVGFRISGFDLSSASVLVVPPGTLLDLCAPVYNDAYTIHLSPRLLGALTGFDEDECRLRFGAQVQNLEYKAGALVRLDGLLMNALGRNQAGYSDAEMEADILGELRRLLRLARLTRMDGNYLRQAARNRIVARAKDHIHANLEERLVIRELCRESGASLSTLERLFKKEVGVSPSRYIQAVRLQRARQLICDEASAGRAISDIAHNCGFTHMGRFSRLYKNQFGVLPSVERGLVTGPG